MIPSFTKEQLEQLQKLLTPIPSSSLLAQKGIFQIPTVFHASAKVPDPWIIDSGATDHMTGCIHFFSSYAPSPDHFKVRIADGSLSVVAGMGTIKITPSIILKSVLHVPKLSCNLLSVSQITKDLNCVANFSHSSCEFQDLISGRRIGSAREHGGLYYFEDFNVNKQAHTVDCGSLSMSREQKIMLWHRRLGHPSFPYLRNLFPELFRNKDSLMIHCEVCQLAKHQRSYFPSQSYKPSRPFAMIHSDIWRPSRVSNLTGIKWFLTFIDDHTRICWVYLLKDKSDAAQTFKNFHSMIQTQFQAKIQILHTDNGREFFNTSLSQFLSHHGIIHQSSCVYTPQQNGVSERKNRHLLEVAQSLMFTTNVPKQFWGDAILTASYLINRMPSKVLNYQTPLNMFLQYYPHTRVCTDLPLKVFGCTSFVHVHSLAQTKLDPRAHKCIFLGYSATQKGYRCYSPEQHKYFISMDVTFFETHPFYAQNSLQGESSNEGNFWEASLPSPIFPQSSELLSPPKLTAVQPCQSQSDLSSLETTQNSSQPMKSTDDENFKTGGETQQQQELRVYSRRNNPQRVEEPVHRQHCQETELNEGIQPQNTVLKPEIADLDVPIALRKGIRSCAQYPISNYVTYDRLSPSLRAFVTNLSGVQIPKNIQEALEDSQWRQAVMEEMSALEQMGTWELVQKPKGKVPVGCKWVFTVKYRSDGSIERYKARLVAKGFTQTYGIDYQETFAPVAKLNTIRVLLSLAANLDWPLQQLDVKNAFLNGDLVEEVYMELPPGFDKEGRGLVCKLKKSLYGLKQSPRAWFDRFSRAIRQQEYKQAQTDHTLFYRHKDGKITVLIVYVDDIILTGNDIVEIKRLKKILATEFDIKDLGSLRYFLGMEVARNNIGISVSQRKYVIDLLKETGMIGCKPVDTPMDANLELGDLKDSIPVERGRYQRLVGKLIYLSHTRPDIAFAVSVVSQFMHAPCEEHMEAVYRILRYLKGTPGKGLLFKKNEARSVEAFTDADWAGSIKDRRSTSGYCTFVWGNLVTWRSKKQSVVARSSAEAEFRAVAQGICELLWLKLLLGELKIADIQPMKLYCDNKAAIDISHNPVHHDRTKHVEVDRHFIKEKIEEGVISMTYVPTSQQTADLLTKGLVKPVFEKLVDKLGMFNVFCPA